jgi:hypothetical protein
MTERASTPSATSRVGTITALSRNEFRVSQSFSDDAAQSRREAAAVTFALIKSECLCVQVPKQIKGFEVYVGSVQGALDLTRTSSAPAQGSARRNICGHTSYAGHQKNDAV